MTQFVILECITFGSKGNSLLTPDGRIWIYKNSFYKCKVCAASKTVVSAVIKTPNLIIKGQHLPSCKGMNFEDAKAIYIRDLQEQESQSCHQRTPLTSASALPIRSVPVKSRVIKKKKQQRAKKATNCRIVQRAAPTSTSHSTFDENDEIRSNVQQFNDQQQQQQQAESQAPTNSFFHPPSQFAPQPSPSSARQTSTTSISRTTISRASKLEADIDDDDDIEILEEIVVVKQAPRREPIMIMPPTAQFGAVKHAPQSGISSTSHVQNGPIVGAAQSSNAIQKIDNVTEDEETETEQFFEDQNYHFDENQAFEENQENPVEEIEAKVELKYDEALTIFTTPSEDALTRACKKLNLELKNSRTAYRFWSQISVTIVKSRSREIQTGPKYTPFDALSLYLSGDAHRGAELWKKMDVKLSEDQEMKEHLGPEKVYQMCLNFSPDHFMLLVHWTKCRIGIFEYGELAQRYGNWKEKSEVTILILKNGEFYSPIFQL